MFCLLVWVVYSTSRLNSSDVLFFFCVSGSSEWQSVCVCVTMKHQSISKWLSQLGLPQYCVALEQEYDGVEVKSRETFTQLLVNNS